MGAAAPPGGQDTSGRGRLGEQHGHVYLGGSSAPASPRTHGQLRAAEPQQPLARPSTPSLAASFPLESVNVGRTTGFTEGPSGPGLQDARKERGREPGPPVSCPQCPVQVPVGPLTAPSPPGPSPGRLVSGKPPRACQCPPRAQGRPPPASPAAHPPGPRGGCEVPSALPSPRRHTPLQSRVPDPEIALPYGDWGPRPGRPLRPRCGLTHLCPGSAAHPASEEAAAPAIPPRQSCPPHTRPQTAHLPPPSSAKGSRPGKGRGEQLCYVRTLTPCAWGRSRVQDARALLPTLRPRFPHPSL